MQRLVGGYYVIATNQADREEPLEFDYDKMLTGADPGGSRGHVHAPCADGHSQTQRNFRTCNTRSLTTAKDHDGCHRSSPGECFLGSILLYAS